jgi:hypothetical protein
MKEQLKEKLLNAAIKRARNLNFNFTNIATEDLKVFISKGVERMTDSEVGDENKKVLAENNLMKLVELMVSEGVKRNLKESLDYKTFSDARMSICPCWPFC